MRETTTKFEIITFNYSIIKTIVVEQKKKKNNYEKNNPKKNRQLKIVPRCKLHGIKYNECPQHTKEISRNVKIEDLIEMLPNVLANANVIIEYWPVSNFEATFFTQL